MKSNEYYVVLNKEQSIKQKANQSMQFARSRIQI